MKKLILAAVLFAGCSDRVILIAETEDASYGELTITKKAKYDAKQHHLGFFESLMGTINPSTLDSVGRIVNGEPSAPAPILTEKSTTVTPVPSGTSVLVQP